MRPQARKRGLAHPSPQIVTTQSHITPCASKMWARKMYLHPHSFRVCTTQRTSHALVGFQPGRHLKHRSPPCGLAPRRLLPQTPQPAPTDVPPCARNLLIRDLSCLQPGECRPQQRRRSRSGSTHRQPVANSPPPLACPAIARHARPPPLPPTSTEPAVLARRSGLPIC